MQRLLFGLLFFFSNNCLNQIWTAPCAVLHRPHVADFHTSKANINWYPFIYPHRLSVPSTSWCRTWNHSAWKGRVPPLRKTTEAEWKPRTSKKDSFKVKWSWARFGKYLVAQQVRPLTFEGEKQLKIYLQATVASQRPWIQNPGTVLSSADRLLSSQSQVSFYAELSRLLWWLVTLVTWESGSKNA